MTLKVWRRAKGRTDRIADDLAHPRLTTSRLEGRPQEFRGKSEDGCMAAPGQDGNVWDLSAKSIQAVITTNSSRR
jgi:hypothetical protein